MPTREIDRYTVYCLPAFMTLFQHWLLNLGGSCHLLSGHPVDRAVRFWILWLGFKDDPWTQVSWNWTNLFSMAYLEGHKLNCRFFWESKWKNDMWAVCCKISGGLGVVWKTKNPQSVSVQAKYSKIRLKNPEYKCDLEAQDWK